MKISPFYTIGTFFFLSFTHLKMDGYIFTDVQSEKVHTMTHGEESQVTVRLFLKKKERKKRENHKFRYGVREPMPLCPVTREIEFRRNVRLGKIEC